MEFKKAFAGVLALSLVLSGCTKDVTETEQRGVSVEVTTADMGVVETNYVYGGKVVPLKQATVFSLVQGIVKKVNFEVGDEVKEGDVLFEMDTEALTTSLKGLEAGYAAAQAGVKVSQLSLESVEGPQMQMQIENAKITYDNAKRAYDNAKIMYDQGFVSEDDLKRAEDGYNQAKQSYELTSKDIIEENTKKAQAGLEASVAQANSAAAQIESVRKSLRDAYVKSPISGTVTGKNVEEGVLLSSAAVPFTISDLSVVTVNVSVSEQIINSLSKGGFVNVKISAVSDNELKGKIKTINPAANMSGTYDVEIEIENSSGNIKSGMFAEASFEREKGYNSVTVIRDAVITKNNETYVFVDNNGSAEKREVVLGVDDGKVVQILKGIEKGDRVVVRGQSYLNSGDLVNVVAVDGKPVSSPQTKEE